jgi:hypothetical protein
MRRALSHVGKALPPSAPRCRAGAGGLAHPTTQRWVCDRKAWIGGSHVDEMIETLLEPCSWQRLATTQKRVLRTPTTVATGGSVRSVDSECEGRGIELRKWDYSRAFGLPNAGGNIDALRRRRDRVRGRNEAPVQVHRPTATPRAADVLRG